jgi:hypothetical protein
VLGKAGVGPDRKKRNKSYSDYEISRIGFHPLYGADSSEFSEPDANSVWPRRTDLLLTSNLSKRAPLLRIGVAESSLVC